MAARIALVNQSRTKVVLTDGTVLPITNMYDEWGDETRDSERAVSFVAGTEGRWYSCLFTDIPNAKGGLQ